MKNRVVRFLFRTFFSAMIYVLFLLPTQFFARLLPGTEVRIAAFIPVVGGIVWGLPAAIGIALGNVVSDLFFYASSPAAIFFGAVFNGLATICARSLFYAFLRPKKDEFIYGVRSLVNYIVTCLVTQLSLSASISVLMKFFAAVPVADSFPLLFLNNFESCMLFGLPLLMFFPRITKDIVYPKHERTEITRIIVVVGMFFPLIALFLAKDSEQTVIFLAADLFCLILTSLFAPRKKPLEDGTYDSIRSGCFRHVISFSIILTLFLSIVYYALIAGTITDRIELWMNLYASTAVLLVTMTLAFSLIVAYIEKNITTPMYNITRHIRRDDEHKLNEIEILSDRLNFVADSTDEIHGNEYTLYIGLTSHDGRISFDSAQAKKTVDEICLRYVSGYISSHGGEGGYRGEESSYSEQVLVYTIFGADDTQIRSIAGEVTKTLEQESILIDKNHVAKWYYYNGHL